MKIKLGVLGEDNKAVTFETLGLKTWYVTTTDRNIEDPPYVGSIKVGKIQSILFLNPDTEDAELIIYIKRDSVAEVAA